MKSNIKRELNNCISCISKIVEKTKNIINEFFLIIEYIGKYIIIYFLFVHPFFTN